MPPVPGSFVTYAVRPTAEEPRKQRREGEGGGEREGREKGIGTGKGNQQTQKRGERSFEGQQCFFLSKRRMKRRRTFATRVDSTRSNLVHEAKHLALTRPRVAAEQDVDLSTLMPSALNVFIRPSEEHRQNSFLHIIKLPNAWSEGGDELLVDIRIAAHCLHAIDAVLYQGLHAVTFLESRVELTVLRRCAILGGDLPIFRLAEMDDVDVGPVDAAVRPHPWIRPRRDGAKDPSHRDAIARLRDVNEILERKEVNGVRRLALKSYHKSYHKNNNR